MRGEAGDANQRDPEPAEALGQWDAAGQGQKEAHERLQQGHPEKHAEHGVMAHDLFGQERVASETDGSAKGGDMADLDRGNAGAGHNEHACKAK